MVSRTSEYALRALIHLARFERDWPIPGNQIAAKTGVPPKYLSAVLSNLVRTGVLRSARGKGGGFSMVRSPKETYLFEVLEPFEPVLSPNRPCPFGKAVCSDDDPCLGHKDWKMVRDGYVQFLRTKTIFEVAISDAKADQEF